MGKIGYHVATVPYGNVADNDIIVEKIFDWLYSEWAECFHNNISLLQYSGKWFHDVLTIEVERETADAGLTFWFNESVDWPSSIAEHWLKVSLASARMSFDKTLANLGLGLRMNEGDHFPTMASVFFRTQPGSPDTIRFVYDSQVWLIYNKGDNKAYAELGEQGGERKSEGILLKDLPDDVHQTVEELIAKNQCACPLCQGIRNTESGSNYIGWVAQGFTLNYVDSWSANDQFKWISGDAIFSLCVRNGTYSNNVVYATNDGGKHFRYANIPEKIIDAAIVKENNALIGLAVNDSDLFKTFDGGRTWIKKNKPNGKIDKLVAKGSCVIAWGNDSSEAYLFISHDSANSFVRLTPPAAQIDKVVFSLSDEKTFYVIVRPTINDKNANVIVTNDDGLTFRSLSPLPFRPEHILTGSDLKVITIAGTEYNDEKSVVDAYVARSGDGGATFTITHKGGFMMRTAVAHPDGHLFFATMDGGVFVSKDEGLTWLNVSNNSMTSMTVDKSGEGDIVCFSYNQMYRLRILI